MAAAPGREFSISDERRAAAMLLYTSGTTGNPKRGWWYSHRFDLPALDGATSPLISAAPGAETRTWFLARWSPMFHANRVGDWLTPAVMCGASQVMPGPDLTPGGDRRLDRRNIGSTVARLGVPTNLEWVCLPLLASRPRLTLSSIRHPSFVGGVGGGRGPLMEGYLRPREVVITAKPVGDDRDQPGWPAWARQSKSTMADLDEEATMGRAAQPAGCRSPGGRGPP